MSQHIEILQSGEQSWIQIKSAQNFRKKPYSWTEHKFFTENQIGKNI